MHIMYGRRLYTALAVFQQPSLGRWKDITSGAGPLPALFATSTILKHLLHKGLSL
jgi:hypothetical protein